MKNQSDITSNLSGILVYCKQPYLICTFARNNFPANPWEPVIPTLLQTMFTLLALSAFAHFPSKFTKMATQKKKKIYKYILKCNSNGPQKLLNIDQELS